MQPSASKLLVLLDNESVLFEHILEHGDWEVVGEDGLSRLLRGLIDEEHHRLRNIFFLNSDGLVVVLRLVLQPFSQVLNSHSHTCQREGKVKCIRDLRH